MGARLRILDGMSDIESARGVRVTKHRTRTAICALMVMSYEAHCLAYVRGEECRPLELCQ